MKNLFKLVAGFLVAIAPMIVSVNACGVIYGETEIPAALREE